MVEHLVFIDPNQPDHGALALSLAAPMGCSVHIVTGVLGSLKRRKLEVGDRATAAEALESDPRVKEHRISTSDRRSHERGVC